VDFQEVYARSLLQPFVMRLSPTYAYINGLHYRRQTLQIRNCGHSDDSAGMREPKNSYILSFLASSAESPFMSLQVPLATYFHSALSMSTLD